MKELCSVNCNLNTKYGWCSLAKSIRLDILCNNSLMILVYKADFFLNEIT